MGNQQQRIAGCRDLSQREIDDINAIRAKEAELARILDNLDSRALADGHKAAGRWAANARMHLELGFMLAVKAVARPDGGLGQRGEHA